MRKAKFWLFQIVMLVMVSLVFGSPVFADKPAVDPGKPSNIVQPDGDGRPDFAGKPAHANGESDNANYHSDQGVSLGGTGDESCVPGVWLFDSAGNFIGVCPL